MGFRVTRREAIGALGGLTLAGQAGRTLAAEPSVEPAVERWGLHEITLNAAGVEQPFDARLVAEFRSGDKTLVVPGFHDGGNVWRIRFSPPETGVWTWRTKSDVSALNGMDGQVSAVAATGANHGPVGVVETYHFAHADGTAFRQVGTTSYGWTHQPAAKRAQTLETLKAAPFNKLRMLVFPNADVATNDGLMPYVKTGAGDRDWDSARFDVAFFQRLDAAVSALCEMGIQADVILFHPYDSRFGFPEMQAEADDRYVRYVVARLSAYRNVWWSLANEFDLLKTKTDADWDRLFQVVQGADPYGRLRSIHNLHRLYDNRKPWVTHSSVQNGSAVLSDTTAETYRSVWEKAVVFDEVCYEGSLDQRWGDLTGPQMVRAFWHGLVAGTYVGHSECFPVDGGFWLGEGGELRGESWPRLAFQKTVMEEGPRPGLEPIDKWWEQHLGGVAGRYYLRYFGDAAPTEWALDVPRNEIMGGEKFRVDVIDTWNMTVEPQPGVITLSRKADTRYYFNDPEKPTLALPGRPWMAVRLTRVD